jgi:hypothetical protein
MNVGHPKLGGQPQATPKALWDIGVGMRSMAWAFARSRKSGQTPDGKVGANDGRRAIDD